MAGKSTSGRIILPDLTAAQLAAQNPVLKNRQLQFEGDTGKAKVGDGVTHWNELTYRIGASTNESSCAVFKIINGTTIDVNAEMVEIVNYIQNKSVATIAADGLIELASPGTYTFEINTLIEFETEQWGALAVCFIITDEDWTDFAYIAGSRVYGKADADRFIYTYTGTTCFRGTNSSLRVRLSVDNGVKGTVQRDSYLIINKISDQIPSS